MLTAAHGNDAHAISMMRNLANKTKGRFYNVTNPKALPRIYQKEARSISRPLIFEQATPWLPKLNYPITEPVMGLTEPLPAITGLVLTSAKENELVEIPMVSPLPAGQLNPVLAHWTYGLGRSLAFTSDAGRRWAKTWPDWESYAAFWSQAIRWSMRPADRGNLTLNVRREEGRIKVVVDALDKNSQFLNFLQIQGNVVDPDLDSGADRAQADGTGPLRNDDRKRRVQRQLLRQPGLPRLRQRSGRDFLGRFGALFRRVPRAAIEPHDPRDAGVGDRRHGRQLEADARRPDRPVESSADHFRRENLINPRSFAPLWPTLLWLAACLFLADVAVRRIALDVDRIMLTIKKEWQRIRGREVVATSEYMDKLRSRKAEVDEQLDRSKAAARVRVVAADSDRSGRGRPDRRANSGGTRDGRTGPGRTSRREGAPQPGRGAAAG